MTEKQGEAAAQNAARYTPGNWTVKTIESSTGFYVYSDQNWPMNHIATCGNEANARLIAQTPKLLEVCIRTERYLQGIRTGRTFEEGDLVDVIRAIIHKATTKG